MAHRDKIAVVNDMRKKIEQATGLVLVDYRGLKGQEMTQLRRKVRETGGDFHVIKNTLFVRAAAGTKAERLVQGLSGPLSVTFGYGDPVELAKLVAQLGKEYPVFRARQGIVEERVLGAEDIMSVSKLPNRQELLARLVYGLQTPMYGLMTTLQGVLLRLIYSLQAIAGQKEGTGVG